jgi:hypothetical protein
MRMQQGESHSITLTARARSVEGTVIPSAVTVSRLISGLTFADFWIGKSAGLSPLSTHPV